MGVFGRVPWLAALALLCPAAADAGTVSVEGGRPVFVASPGETNVVAVSYAPGTFTIQDSSAQITAGPGCTAQGATTARCASTAGQIEVALGDLNDRFSVSGTACRCSGGDGNDRLFGGTAGDTLSGDAGDDELDGRAGRDDLRGATGADTLRGGEGPDRLSGGDGLDRVSYSDRLTPVVVTPGGSSDDGGLEDGPEQARDNVSADVENLRGGSAGDRLVGTPAANVLIGGDGDDELEGRAGPDLLGGEGGSDTASYSMRGSGVTVSIDDVANDGNADDGPIGARDFVRPDVENLTGGNAGDNLFGNQEANIIDGRGGRDVMFGLEGIDTASYTGRSAGVSVTIDGQPNDGNDQDGPPTARDHVGADIENLTGGSGDDRLEGSGGPNTLDGGAGGDFMIGNGGLDTATYADHLEDVIADLDGVADDGSIEDGRADNVAADIESVVGGLGDDRLTAAAASTVLNGGTGNDLLQGRAGDDTLTGGPGDDTLRGDLGEDALHGQEGNDRLDGGEGADDAVGGEGTDTMTYLSRSEALTVRLDGVANDGSGLDGLADNVQLDVENVIGGAGDDFLVGNPNRNVLQGGDGEDTLDGQDGDDRLDGGAQADTLIGGKGPNDLATYAQRQLGVTVDFDGNADDGNSIDESGGRRDDARADIEGAVGGAGDDTLIGSERINLLDGQGGADVLTGGIQEDVLLGGAGDDQLDGGEGRDALQGDSGDDDLSGGALRDTLVGGEDDDLLRGGPGSDNLSGDLGDDVLAGGANADIMSGGDGLDTADYSDHSGPVTVDLQQEAGQGGREDCREGREGGCFPGFEDFIARDVENVLGSPGDDLLTGDSFANVLTGGPGDDVLTGLEGRDSLIGLAGDDVLLADDGEQDGDLDCGDGTSDGADVDAADPAPLNCEAVN